MSKIRENRVDVMMISTIGAGNFMFEGTVNNISRNGFMVAGLPMRFNSDEKKMSSIISCRQGSFKMNVRASWVKPSGGLQDAGFEILDYGSAWMRLLDELDPVNRDLQRRTAWVDKAVEHPNG
jgi:hypothetical protein